MESLLVAVGFIGAFSLVVAVAAFFRVGDKEIKMISRLLCIRKMVGILGIRLDITPSTFITIEWNAHKDDKFFGYWRCGNLSSINFYFISIWLNTPRKDL